MKANGADASTKLASTAKGQEVATKQPSFKDWLTSKAESFRDLIPAGTVDLNRFIKAAIIEITNNHRLMACSRDSIIMSIGQCARYGLEPGALLGQAWLIPYNESKQVNGQWQKIPTCHFQLGYKGLIALARRSNTIKTISAEPVYQSDVDSGRFVVELGTDRKLIHKPDFFSDRGDVIGYYAAISLTNGETQFAIMSKKDIVKHKERFSKAAEKQGGKGKDSVWDTDFDSMALKTVIIKALKLAPISIEAMEAINREEAEDRGEPISSEAANAIMGEYEVFDEANGNDVRQEEGKTEVAEKPASDTPHGPPAPPPGSPGTPEKKISPNEIGDAVNFTPTKIPKEVSEEIQELARERDLSDGLDIF